MDTPQQAPVTPQEDLSSKTIVLLVILTLTVSFIGAWVNINTAMTASAPQQPNAPSATSAQVSLEIEGPKAPQVDGATAMATFTIEP